jgi:hypothetical protein
MFVFVVLFIPKERYRSLFWLSLLWGFFVCHLSIIAFSGLFHLFRWEHAEPFVFIDAPIFIKTAWLLAMMIYFYFLPRRREWYVIPLYIFMFSFLGAAIDDIFHQIGLLTYYHWNPWFRFFLGLIWFSSATIHYRRLYPEG